MPSLDDVTQLQASLPAEDAAWLQALVADWQMIADLAFSDLVLWVPDPEARGVRAVAQVRPTTGPTSLLVDVVGTFWPAGRAPLVERAFAGTAMLTGEPDALGRTTQAVPVRRAGRCIAVVERRRETPGLRSAGALESAYVDVADDLLEMIRRGEFPGTVDPELTDSVRVGDGFVRTAADGVVRFASPNALSAYRRLGLVGDLVGVRLADVTAGLVDRRGGAARQVQRVPGLLTADEAGSGEVENGNGSLFVRVIPLRTAGAPGGSLVLLRDVTELRLRERELLSKDATIREIHHRVKNNLQTVAALLRLQSRRLENPEARHALDEAVRRVGSIAVVHETLSQSFGDFVDFDDIADRLLRTVLDVSRLDVASDVPTAGGRAIQAERIGSFGTLPGSVATPLSMALTELIQNAAEHAGAGHLTIAVNRIRGRVRLRVSDDGVGLPPDFSPESSLGLSIVATLIRSELHGTLDFESRPGHGTTVSIALQV